MALTEEETRRAIAHLTEHWGACPMCEHKGWAIAGHITFGLADTPLGFGGSGRALACIAAICRRCGYTALVNTRVALGTVAHE